MVLRSLSLTGLIVSALFMTGPAYGAPSRPIHITKIKSSGRGCPQGTVSATIAPDGSALSVLYDRFNLEVAPGHPGAEMKCEVQIYIELPGAPPFGIESADFRGFVWLDPGMAASQVVSVSVGLPPYQSVFSAHFGEKKWRGPIQQEFLLKAVRPDSQSEDAQCGVRLKRTLVRINSRLRVSPRQSRGGGQIAVDTADGQTAVQTYRLRWKECSNNRTSANSDDGSFARRTL